MTPILSSSALNTAFSSHVYKYTQFKWHQVQLKYKKRCFLKHYLYIKIPLGNSFKACSILACAYLFYKFSNCGLNVVYYVNFTAHEFFSTENENTTAVKDCNFGFDFQARGEDVGKVSPTESFYILAKILLLRSFQKECHITPITIITV